MAAPAVRSPSVGISETTRRSKATTTVTTSYDEVAYPGNPHPDARPSRLAAIAALLGFRAAAPQHCRVLELGAGDGSHLIPLALEQPGAHFLGIDLAGKAIERGQARIQQLGLSNITLLQGDIATVELTEPFDYIIAHGVYSWVPPEVQQALLTLCRRALAPQGLAYISYATYPGCHQREMVRNLMLFHTARLSGAADIVNEGLQWARFVARHQTGGEAYAGAIEREVERMQAHGVGYAFHDDFAEHNSPVYFGELVERVREHGLDFFAEALFLFFDDARLPADVMAMVETLSGGDVVTREQYLDFLRGRAFRQSLFCHAGARPSAPWRIEAMLDWHAASTLVSKTPELALDAQTAEIFVSPKEVELRAERPLVRAVLRRLASAWPSALPIVELIERAEAQCGAASPEQRGADRELLLVTLLRAAAVRLIELDVAPPAIATAVTERPRAHTLARLEAQTGLTVTDLWHRRLKLEDEASRVLLTLLDGSRDHAALATAMHQFFNQQLPTPLSLDELGAELTRVLTEMQKRALLSA